MPNSSFSNRKSSKLKRILVWFFIISVIVTSGLGFLLSSNQPTDDLFIRLDEFAYFIEEGDSTLVTFEASPQLGSFNYVSYDSDVVQFIENRLIAVSPGNATIMVSSQSNPSVFQTVSVIVRPRDVEPEAPVEPEVPAEPEPEVPVDVEPELPEDQELEVPVNPVDPTDPDDESIVTPPTIYTVTITNETGAVITTLSVEEGSLISEADLELPELFKGFYLEGETCTDDPFDLETPITEDLNLIQASYNDEAPCLQLDYIVLSGRPVAGTELTVDIFPIGANVTISWYTSVNNRTYREIPGESRTTFTVRPEDSGKFIRVYVVSDSNQPVVRYDTIKLDVFGTVSETDNRIPLTQEEQASASAIIAAGSIPIAYPEDLEAIGDSPEALSRSYVLIRDIDLSNYQTLDNSFINGTFSGNLSGQGFTISNLTINAPNSDQIGLFSKISGAAIENLIIDGFNIIGRNNTGLMVGLIESGSGPVTMNSITITNSSLTGGNSLGAFIGRNLGTKLTMSQLFNYANISSSSSWVGGLVGVSTNELLIEQSLNYGTIRSGGQYTGGLVGILWNSTDAILREIGNFGLIIASSDGAGGLVGGTSGITPRAITITNGFNLGPVQIIVAGRNNAGGIIGYIDNATITFSALYSAAEVTSAGFRAGLIFGLANTIAKAHTDAAVFSLNTLEVQVDGYTSSSSNNAPTSAFSTKIPVFNMITKNTFGNATWDIETHPTNSGIWSIGFNGDFTYPYLTFQDSPNLLQEVELSQNEYEQGLFLLEKIAQGFIPIYNETDLSNVKNNLTANYILANDIEITTEITNSTSFITGIFEGILEGNGRTISGLAISGTTSSRHIGLFETLRDSEIRNVNIDNFVITYNPSSGTGNTGILAGRVSGGNNTISSITITNSLISNSATNSINTGMIGATSGNTTILNVSLEYEIFSNSQHIGMIIGVRSSGELIISGVSIIGSIENSLDRSGTNKIGGAIGNINSIQSITLQGIISNVTINSLIANHVGGIIGGVEVFTDSGDFHLTIQETTFLGNIYSKRADTPNNVGGIIGELNKTNAANDFEIIFSNVSFAGYLEVNSNQTHNVGGLIGNAGGLFVSTRDRFSLILNHITSAGIITTKQTSSSPVFGGIVGRTNIISNGSISGHTINVSVEITRNNRFSTNMSTIIGQANNKSIVLNLTQIINDSKIRGTTSDSFANLEQLANITGRVPTQITDSNRLTQLIYQE